MAGSCADGSAFARVGMRFAFQRIIRLCGEPKMPRSILCALTALCAFVLLHSQAPAQRQSPAGAFEQNTYVYEPWIKGKFSEVVTVKNPRQMDIPGRHRTGVRRRREDFVPGRLLPAVQVCVLSDQETPGAAWRYAEERRVRDDLYDGDIRHIGASGKCRTEEFAEAGAELPPGASVGVNAFAWPDMLLEIAATAAVEK